MRLVALGAAGLVTGVMATVAVPAVAEWTQAGQTVVTAQSSTLLPPVASVRVSGTTASLTVDLPAGGASPTSYEVRRGTTIICGAGPDGFPAGCTDEGLPAASDVEYTVEAGIGDFWRSTGVVSAEVPPPAPTLALDPDSDSGEPGDGDTTDTTPVVLVSAGEAANPYSVTVTVDGVAVGQVIDVPRAGTMHYLELPELPAGDHQVAAVATYGNADSTVAALDLTVLETTRVETLTLATAASEGGRRGNLKNGDSLTLGVSAPIDPGSVCSTWESGADGAGRSVDVMVTVVKVNDGVSRLTVAPEAMDGCGDNALNFGVLTMMAAPGGEDVEPATYAGSLTLGPEHRQLMLVIGTEEPVVVWQLQKSYMSFFVPSALLVDSQGEPLANGQVTTTTVF